MVELAKTHPEPGMSLKAERCDRACPPSLSTWPGHLAVQSQGTVEVSRDMACDRAMLFQV